MSVESVYTVETAGGHSARFVVRPDTNDAALVAGIITGREYPFDRMQGMTGWALDIGAHIGIVTVAMALDNPGLRIVAVEALSENAEQLRRNVELNGLADRVTILNAAAGLDEPTEIGFGYEYVPEESDEANRPGGYVQASRFIGNIYSPREGMRSKVRMVEGVSLTALLASHGIDRVSFAKIDIEGGEWTVLKSPAVDRVDWWIGEAHGDPGMAGIRDLLPNHVVTQIDDNPVNPIFEAVLRGR